MSMTKPVMDLPPGHATSFIKAAIKFECEIAIRVPNPASIKFYLGKRGYKPKPGFCDAKTATANSKDGKYKWAGLVVSPLLCPDAFATRENYRDAEKAWKARFQSVLKSNLRGYRVNEVKEHRHYGCVTHHGSYLYSDYDLMSVKKQGQLIPGSAYLKKGHNRIDQWHQTKGRTYPEDVTNDVEREISDFLQMRCSIQLQHGSEMNFRNAPERQWCHIFRPDKPHHKQEIRP